MAYNRNDISQSLTGYLRWAIMVFGAGLAMLGCKPKPLDNPTAFKGEIDLAQWDFAQHGPVALQGQWEFYWHSLIEPGHFGQRQLTTKQYIEVPGLWNDHLLKTNETIGIGYGTYRLKVNNPGPYIDIALEIPSTYCSYRMWVDGILIAENGTVATKKAKNKGLWLPLTKAVALEQGQTQVEIVWQIANFKHSLGGPPDPILIGTTNDLFAKRNAAVTASMLLLGGCAAMAMFFFAFYFLFNRDKASLYFSITCFTWAIRPLFSNLYLLHFFAPGLNWQWATKIEYFTVYAVTLYGLLFIVQVFGKDSDKYVVKYLMIIVYIFAAITLVTPVYIFSYLLLPFQVFALLILCYIFSLIFKAVSENRREALLSALSVLFAILMFIYEILALQHLLPYNAILMGIGYFAVFLFNSLTLGYRYTKAVRPAEG